jgi:hypothetical protein
MFNHCRLPIMILAVLWGVVAPARTMTAVDDPDGDGMPGLADSPPPLHDNSAGLVVISKDLSYCYFGLYRAIQMAAEPWDLLDRTVAAMLSPAGGSGRILIITYLNQFVPPVHYLQEDGYAVYQHLRLAGYQVTGRDQSAVPDLDVDFLRQFDLIVHWHTGGYGLGQVLESGVPLLTVCPWHASALGLGTYAQDHRIVESVCISEIYGPTAGCVPGDLGFGDWMWSYEVRPAEDVLTLVRFRCPTVATETMSWGSLKSAFH